MIVIIKDRIIEIENSLMIKVILNLLLFVLLLICTIMRC